MAFDPLIKEFESAHPEIDVQATYLPAEQLVTVVSTQLQAGSASDMFHIAAGASHPVSALVLAPEGKLLDLSNEPWAAKVPEQFKSLFSYDGKLYGSPLFVNFVPVLYNVDEFQKLGLEPPKTFPEMLSLCKSISDQGKVPISHGGSGGAGNYLLVSSLASSYVYGAGGATFNAAKASGKTSFADSPEWKTVMDRILDMKDAGCFGPGVAGVDVEQAITSFANSDGLMYIGTTSGGGLIKATNPDINYSIFAMPGDTAEETQMTTNGGASLAINPESPRIEQAKTFYEFLVSEERLGEFALTIGGVSPASFVKRELPPELEPAQEYIADGRTIIDPALVDPAWPSGAVLGALGDSVTGLLTGQKSGEDVLKAMDAAWTE